MTTYAVNIADLTALAQNDAALSMVLMQHVAYENVVEAERGKAVGMGHAALMSCPTEQTEALIAVIRRKLRKYQLRFYRSETGTGGWKRV